MKLDQFLKTREGALSENKLSRPIILIQMIVILVLATLVMGKETVVVMVPPTVDREVTVGPAEASPGMKEAWGAWFATTLGNVTPRTAPGLSEMLGRVMAPQTYNEMMSSVAEQADRMARDQLSISFVPNQVFHVADKDVVVVSGEYTIRGMRDAEQRMVRTYEIGVRFRSYMPSVVSLEVYEGPWTADREARERAAQEREARSAAR